MSVKLLWCPLVLCVAALAACGGGGSGSSTVQSTVPVSVPSPTPPPAALSAPGTTQTFTNIGGFGGSISLPHALTGNGNPVVAVSASAPSGVPALSGGLLLIPLLYVQITSPTTITLAAVPAFSIAIPTGLNLGLFQLYVAAYDSSNASQGWRLGIEGPVTANGNATLTGSVSPFTLMAGTQYVFALYAQPH